MSLHFGICWIEDQTNEAEVEQVKQAVRNSGFEPRIELVADPEGIMAFAQKQDHHQSFDLILLDLNLGKGLLGDQLASDVRAAFRSTTILFYSALDEGTLRAKMAEQRVEGVFCVHRKGLASRVEELVAHMTPALNRLSTMRGLAARVVAECDADFRAILAHLGQGEAEAEIVAGLKDKARQASTRHTEEIEKLDRLSAALSSHAIQSAQLFAEAKEQASKTEDEELGAITRYLRKNYLSQVIHRRNTLAHALEAEKDGGGWEIVRSGKDSVTVGDFARFRADFSEQLRLVHRMREILIGH